MAKKVTSKAVASKASKILKDDRYSKVSKSVAGSALSQAEKKVKNNRIGMWLRGYRGMTVQRQNLAIFAVVYFFEIM